jgi:hypothetical protein
MPQQETFSKQATDDGRLQILKTYDRPFARQAFTSMDEDAQTYLWNSLGIDQNYDPTDVRPLHDPDSEDFLWEELIEPQLLTS